MFMGEYLHNIDAKGRVIVPSKLREGLGNKFIVTKGLDRCLTAYTLDEWAIFQEKLAQLPSSRQDVRKFTRYFFAGACECETDNQGRIMIPQNLREHAGLEKNIVSIGVANKVEIWSKATWENYNDEENFVDVDLAEKMAEFGI